MHSDSNPSPAEEPGELPESCRSARAAIAAYVGSSNTQEGTMHFRGHLTQCSDCMTIYRQAMAVAARMGRNLREGRVDDSRVRRQAARAERAKKATGEPGRRNRFALRLALLPAAFALLIVVQRALRPTEGLTLHWNGGEVHVGEQRLNKEYPKRALTEEGLLCYTRGNATAEIYANTDEERPRFELGMQSTLLVTDPKHLEVRLESGDLVILGRARVLSQYGIIEMEAGHAVASLRNLKFRLECLEGSLTFLTAAGEQVLQAGESLERGG